MVNKEFVILRTVNTSRRCLEEYKKQRKCEISCHFVAIDGLWNLVIKFHIDHQTCYFVTLNQLVCHYSVNLIFLDSYL